MTNKTLAPVYDYRAAMKRIVMSIPSWALCYLVNGDPSGLSDEDIEAVDQWVNLMIEDGYKVSSLCLVDVEEEPRFTTCPEFGLPCDCVECVIFEI